MVGRTFSFIALPRDVSAPSVSIGSLLFSHIVLYRSMTVNTRVHYPHPSLLKTSSPDQHMKEHQQVYFIISWSIKLIHSGTSISLIAFAAITKDIQSPCLSGRFTEENITCKILWYVWLNDILFYCGYQVNTMYMCSIYKNVLRHIGKGQLLLSTLDCKTGF